MNAPDPRNLALKNGDTTALAICDLAEAIRELRESFEGAGVNLDDGIEKAGKAIGKACAKALVEGAAEIGRALRVRDTNTGS